MRKIRWDLNTIANISLILMALTLAVMLARTIRPKTQQIEIGQDVAHRQPELVKTLRKISIGSVRIGAALFGPGFTLPPEALDDNTKQLELVLGVSSRCSVCAREVPIYQELAKELAVASGRIPVVIMAPPTWEGDAVPEQETRDWIVKNGLPGRLVIPSNFPFQATPTVLLINLRRIKAVWVGGMNKPRQDSFFKTIRAADREREQGKFDGSKDKNLDTP